MPKQAQRLPLGPAPLVLTVRNKPEHVPYRDLWSPIRQRAVRPIGRIARAPTLRKAGFRPPFWP